MALFSLPISHSFTFNPFKIALILSDTLYTTTRSSFHLPCHNNQIIFNFNRLSYLEDKRSIFSPFIILLFCCLNIVLLLSLCCFIYIDCFISVLFRYRPTITLDFLQTELGYTADCSDDRDSLNKFLVEQGAKLTADSSRIDCKIGLNPPPAQS